MQTCRTGPKPRAPSSNPRVGGSNPRGRAYVDPGRTADSGSRTERDFNRIYAEAAREPFELWDLPDVRIRAAIRERTDEYEEVVSFLDDALAR